MGRETQPKIVWGITGAGHFLSSCIPLILNLQKVDIFLSKAGKEVLQYYSCMDQLTSSGHSLIYDTNSSSLPVTGLYTGKYDLVVIAPVTSNTVAKMACGIADNLITNLFAHAGKCRIPTILLPCDSTDDILSVTPHGKQVPVYVREIDRDNIKTLAGWDGVWIAHNPEQLKQHINKFCSQN